MNMEEIIRAWKIDAEALEPRLPVSPVGQEVSEEELLEISGGEEVPTCGNFSTCPVTCGPYTF